MIQGKLDKKGVEKDFQYLVAELYSNLTVAPSTVYEDEVPEAYREMKEVDEKDTEFVALASTLDCPVITNESDFWEQDLVPVLETASALDRYLFD